jgi:ATP-dependent Clp protease ATP-binding subunit ClpC
MGAKANLSTNKKAIGFGNKSAEFTEWNEADKEQMLDDARKELPPELWGRIEEKCVFGPLTEKEVRAIATLLIGQSSARLQAERQISYQVDSSVLDYLIDEGGYEPTMGARPMRRAVERCCETAIARAILRGDIKTGDTVLLQAKGGVLEVAAEVEEATPDPVTPG